MTSFSPAFEPEVATRKSELAALELGAERAVLRLALLGDVHRREDLEDVDHRVAGGPVERLGGVEDAVDPVPDRELLGGRLEVDVGGAAEHRVVDQFLGRHVRPRFLCLADPRSGPPWPSPGVLPTNWIGGPARSVGPTSLLNSGRIPSFMQHAVGHLADVVGGQHLLVIGDGLVPDVDVGQQGDEISQEQERHAHGVDGIASTRTRPSTPGEEHDAVPGGELEVVQLLGVVFDPVGGPDPEQVDQEDGDELEEVQVHPRSRGDARRLGQQQREDLGGFGGGGEAERSRQRNIKSTRNGRIIDDLSPERCVAFRRTGIRCESCRGRRPTTRRHAASRDPRDVRSTADPPCRGRLTRLIAAALGDGANRAAAQAARRGTRRAATTAVPCGPVAGPAVDVEDVDGIQGNAIVMPFGSQLKASGPGSRVPRDSAAVAEPRRRSARHAAAGCVRGCPVRGAGCP